MRRPVSMVADVHVEGACSPVKLIGDGVAEGEAKRGRPKHLTREIIVEAAAKFSQRGLNLSDLAASLDVTPQSLYHYFPSIKAIDAAVADLVVRRVPEPDPNLRWQDYVREQCLLYRGWALENEYTATRSYEAVSYTHLPLPPNREV